MKKLSSAIEAILLIAERPVSLQELAAATSAMLPAIQGATTELTRHYHDRGLQIIRKGDYLQLVSAPDQAEVIQRFFHKELRKELSRAALETLAIVAYREPITRGEIEELRGVSSDTSLRTLQIRGLIREVGRTETVGRPILYGVTMEFLQHFGLSGPSELPPMPKLPELPITPPKSELFQGGQ